MASAKKKIGDFLLANVGKTVNKEQLARVAGISEWARRVRELREDDGWPILSHNDRGDLKPGEYVLESAPASPGYSFPRRMSPRIRAQVLERNGYTCQMCGAGAGDTVGGRKVRLHIGHVTDRVHGGRDELSNLRALCSDCNQGAKNMTQEPPSWAWLLSQIRRAKASDQEKALEWLQKRFGAD